MERSGGRAGTAPVIPSFGPAVTAAPRYGVSESQFFPLFLSCVLLVVNNPMHDEMCVVLGFWYDMQGVGGVRSTMHLLVLTLPYSFLHSTYMSSSCTYQLLVVSRQRPEASHPLNGRVSCASLTT